MACQCKGDRVAQAVMKRIRGKRVGIEDIGEIAKEGFSGDAKDCPHDMMYKTWIDQAHRANIK